MKLLDEAEMTHTCKSIFFSLQFQKIQIFWPQSLKNINTPIFKLYLGLIMLCMPVCFVIMLLLTPITAHVSIKRAACCRPASSCGRTERC